MYKIDSDNVWGKPFKKFLDRYACPCCNYPTLHSRNGYEICGLCFWEDDGQDDENADEILGGPNSNYSLTEARNNFKLYLTMYRPSDTIAYNSQIKRKDKLLEIKQIYEDVLKKDEIKDFEIIIKDLKRASFLSDQIVKHDFK